MSQTPRDQAVEQAAQEEMRRVVAEKIAPFKAIWAEQDRVRAEARARREQEIIETTRAQSKLSFDNSEGRHQEAALSSLALPDRQEEVKASPLGGESSPSNQALDSIESPALSPAHGVPEG